MKNLKQDPKKLLLANLSLVKGIQFSNPMGEILVASPLGLESTAITTWQYRLMLSMDGSEQFIEVVRTIKSQFDGEFVAADVWAFLDWMIENELVEERRKYADNSSKRFPYPLPDVITQQPARSRFRMPLQVIGVSLLCLTSLGGSYLATPLLVTLFKSQPAAKKQQVVAPVAKTAAITEKKASRIPEVAEKKEVSFASRAPQAFEALPELPGDAEATPEPNLIEKLMGMRQEMAACQIRRDEYYLLNDETGYSGEVARITELVKEIGEIRSRIID